MKLTTATLRSLALPAGLRERTYFDETLPGFGIRLRAGGGRSWVVQYKLGSKHRRMTLGSIAALELGKARASAKDLLAKVRLGRDPAGERLAQREKMSETFSALMPPYLMRQRSRLKPRSCVEVERHLTVHAKSLHSHNVAGIDRRTIAILLQKIDEQSGPGAANRTRASLSSFFVWLAREGIIEANPVSYTNRSIEIGARDRVLTDAELVQIWRTAGDGQYGAIVKLLILTGARRAELADLRWSEVDIDSALITLPGGRDGRTKSKKPHEIPLSPSALAILQAQPRRKEANGNARDLVFGHGSHGWQNWTVSKRELDARADVSDWRLHDFRRTLSTTMHERLGILPHVVEAVLGHVSGHKSGVAGVYNRSAYRDQKRIALEKWAEHIEALMQGGKRSAAVVKLRRQR
jgi:integrase